MQVGSVIRKYRITDGDGKRYSTNHYSLEMTGTARIRRERKK